MYLTGLGQLTDELKNFAASLSTEQGKYVYFDKQAVSAEMFLKWLVIYDPTTAEYFAKINSLKAEGQSSSEVPGWVKTGQIRVKQEIFDLYQASIDRVGRILRDQGVLVVTVKEDVQGFLSWWMQYDRAGFAAFIVTNVPVVVSADTLMSTDIPSISVPQSLFNFWKANQGALAPTNTVLGIEWVGWAMAKKYWIWILAGVAGGVVLAKGMSTPEQREAARRRREARSFAMADTLPGVIEGPKRNPKAKFHDAWPSTISLKSGKYDLIPLIPDVTYQELRAMNQRIARRFRVVSDGRTLGELHKSRGRRPWKAVSYQGVQKYGRNRGALLTWLKQEAPLQAAQAAAVAPVAAKEAQQVAKALAANARSITVCNGCH